MWKGKAEKEGKGERENKEKGEYGLKPDCMLIDSTTDV